jgi:hypothetical protein
VGGAVPGRFVAQSPSFAGAVALSFDQIRMYGRTDVYLVAHLLETLGSIARLVPSDPTGALALAPAYVRASVFTTKNHNSTTGAVIGVEEPGPAAPGSPDGLGHTVGQVGQTASVS